MAIKGGGPEVFEQDGKVVVEGERKDESVEWTMEEEKRIQIKGPREQKLKSNHHMHSWSTPTYSEEIR